MEIYNQRILLKYVSDLQVSIRIKNFFYYQNIQYLGDLVTKTEDEILRCPNIGKKSTSELKEILSKINMSFGMKIDGWNKENVEKLASEFYPEEYRDMSQKEIEDRFFSEMNGNFSSIVHLKELRKMKLEEHQQIINNYCRYSKSPFKNRNIIIYDCMVLRKKNSKETTEELNIKYPVPKIQNIVDKGFYKDLLKYWELSITDRGDVEYTWKK
jgi:hypothetical protein